MSNTQLKVSDITPYIFDPNRIQNKTIEWMNSAIDGKLDIVDPTNPFTMLLEAVAVTSSANAIESVNGMRRLYPSLASNRSDLYPHLNDDALVNIFAIPATAILHFSINVLELRQHGYREVINGNPNNFTQMTIPKYTYVTVVDTVFTLLNNIDIKLYDNGTVFVEQQSSAEDIAINDIGIISAAITNDTDGTSWIVFETKIKQVTRIASNDTITAGSSYRSSVEIKDQFYFASFSYKNAYTNGRYRRLHIAYDDSNIASDVPTVFVKQSDTTIDFNIPDVYIIDGGIDGTANIVTYTTKGKVYLPLANYSMNNFVTTLGNTGGSETTAVAANISILAGSRYIVDSGANMMTTEELQSAIIDNTVGNVDIPITAPMLKQKGRYKDYEIFKALDIITERIYIASRNTSATSSTLLNSRADIFSNTTKITLGNYLDNANVYVDDDIFIIKSNTVFKEVNNVVTIIDNSELDILKHMNKNDLKQACKDTKYFFTPYYYVIDKTDTQVNSRVYDLDNPSINSIQILAKNVNVSARVNTDKYTILKTTTGYDIVFTITGNNDFSNLEQRDIKAQLSVLLSNNTEYVHYQTNYDPNSKYITFSIDTDDYIDSDNNISVTNGESILTTMSIPIIVDAMFYIYTIDTTIIDDTNYLVNEIYSAGSDVTVFSKEKINITFGNYLGYIWNRLKNVYSERKYMKYTQDVPAVYAEDVYEKDPVTGAIFTTSVDNNGDTTLTYNKIHSAGDPILDNNGDPTIAYVKGELVLDSNGLPLVDQLNGIIRYVDILMLEYEYSLATSTVHINYKRLLLEGLRTWILQDMKDLNNVTLENTEVFYKSYKSSVPVKINTGSVIQTIPYNVSPVVTIYVNKNRYTLAELSMVKTKIGTILHDNLDSNDVSLAVIKNLITTTVDSNIIGVKVENIDGGDELELFTINDKTVRLALNKMLTIDNNNDLVVEYDIDLNIKQVS